jgi:hypothetical protein
MASQRQLQCSEMLRPHDAVEVVTRDRRVAGNEMRVWPAPFTTR